MQYSKIKTTITSHIILCNYSAIDCQSEGLVPKRRMSVPHNRKSFRLLTIGTRIQQENREFANEPEGFRADLKGKGSIGTAVVLHFDVATQVLSSGVAIGAIATLQVDKRVRFEHQRLGGGVLVAVEAGADELERNHGELIEARIVSQNWEVGDARLNLEEVIFGIGIIAQQFRKLFVVDRF